MNWYKESQVVLDKDRHNRNYFDIGHSHDKFEWMQDIKSKEYNEDDKIWIWYKGKLFIDEGSKTHMGLVNELNKKRILNLSDIVRTPMFQGRFDVINGRKRVSIKPSVSQQFRDIPNPLIKSLVSEFGRDIEIYTF